MRVYRSPGGEIIEESTENLNSSQSSNYKHMILKRKEYPSSDLDIDTRPLHRPNWSIGPNSQDDENTRIFGLGLKQGTTHEPKMPNDTSSATQECPMDDPVAGWLVITKGPGKGHSLQVGIGVNSIGRDNSNRLSLSFGDTEISRSTHSVVTYDPLNRKFYVNHGGGTNLTYINGSPVLSPTELISHTEIQLGNTTLLFIPFCGDDFDWVDHRSTIK
ncbi:FHA domain-containing protein [Microbulbifer epialgicus]|uniref:FHA domain-containing protein n=1 Tax=Microbulbifer epialgicus TaxID=393907 RepID=A0ABV4NUK6_9GAMM